ncbi:MAG: tripartite tricarboxylate transporter substrate-binding protein [Burkholderiales bacterium]
MRCIMKGMIRPALAALFACGTPAVMAQSAPPLRVMIGLPPGGTLELMTRLIADRIKTDTDRTVIVDHRPGAISRIAIEQMKLVAPDGNTILILPIANTAVFPHTYKNLGYDPFSDLAPISQAATFYNAFAVGPNVQAKTLAEYVALVKREPRRGDYASSGSGSIPHFLAVMFARASGIEMTHIPYKGAAQVPAALLSGEVNVAVLTDADLARLHQSGKARVLATTGPARSVVLPDISTFREQGYDIVGTGWFGFFSPGKTPAPVNARLAETINRALANAEVRGRLAEVGLNATGTMPAEFAAIIKSDYAYWGKIVKQTGFVAD